MKTIKYLLLVLLCYCTAQVYSQNKASWVPDSIASQIPVIQNQAREWKQKIYENPKDEKAWCSISFINSACAKVFSVSPALWRICFKA